MTAAWDAYNNRYKPETKPSEGLDWRSRVYFPMTTAKVNVAISQISDVWFQGGLFPFDIINTPKPDSPNDHLKALGFDLDKRIENMKKTIMDQFVEARMKDEFLKLLQFTSMFGYGVIRAPFIKRMKRNRYKANIPPVELPAAGASSPEELQQQQAEIQQFIRENATFELEQFEEVVPTAEALDPWDFFADPESDGDSQKMNGMFFRTIYTPAEFYDLGEIKDSRSKFVYDREAIHEILGAENKDMLDSTFGPHRFANGTSGDDPQKTIICYEYAGVLTKKDLLDYGTKFGMDLEDISDIDPVEVIVTFCREKVIRIIKNPFPGKMRPYHMVQWERIPGDPYGRGIPEKLEHPQSFVNGMTRAYIDNKNLASNLQFAIREDALADGMDLKQRPGKNWRFREGVDVREAFDTIVVPDITQGILEAINMASDWGDQASGIPKVLEGEQVSGPRETAFQVNEKVKSAIKQLGLVLKYFDERIIEPVVRSFYRWNMQFNPDPDIKGDFDILATGFATFQNKTLKGAALQSFLQLMLQFPDKLPSYDIEKIIDEIARTQDLDPMRLKKSDEQLKIDQQLAQEEAQRAAQAQADAIAAEDAKEKEAAQADRDFKAQQNKLDRDTQMKKVLLEVDSRERAQNKELLHDAKSAEKP